MWLIVCALNTVSAGEVELCSRFRSPEAISYTQCVAEREEREGVIFENLSKVFEEQGTMELTQVRIICDMDG
jgi:hypothetical protein